MLAALLPAGVAGCAAGSPEPQIFFAPRAGGDGLPVSTPVVRGIDPAELAAVFEHVARDPAWANAYALLLLVEGDLIAEGYFRGNQPSRRNNVKSVTKSVLSLLVGIAIEQGHIASLEQPIADFLPQHIDREADPKKRAITIGDLLTMQAGLEWREHLRWFDLDWDPARMYRARDPVGYVLGKPMEDDPGGHFHYSTGTSQLLAAVLRSATGRTPQEFAAAHLLGPLGIDDVEWSAARDGNSHGGVGLQLTPREMALIGQLMLQRGRWQGTQLVSEAWIEESTRAHTFFGYSDGPYGYHWWVRPHGFTAQGARGQYIYVVPEADLVVVIAAKSESPRHIPLHVVDGLVVNRILPTLGSGEM